MKKFNSIHPQTTIKVIKVNAKKSIKDWSLCIQTCSDQTANHQRWSRYANNLDSETPVYCIDHIYQKLSSTESDNERRNQVEGEADKEVSQMGQKDPMQVPIQHDVGPIQVSVVEVA